jgi:hypothetical protein
VKPLTANASTVAATLAGALTAVIVWAVGSFTTVTVPPEIASAITAIITIAVQAWVPDPPITPAQAVQAQIAAQAKEKKK